MLAIRLALIDLEPKAKQLKKEFAENIEIGNGLVLNLYKKPCT